MNFESEASLEVAGGGPTMGLFALTHDQAVACVLLNPMGTQPVEDVEPTVREIFLVF